MVWPGKILGSSTIIEKKITKWNALNELEKYKLIK
jgi:hypothetical protein